MYLIKEVLVSAEVFKRKFVCHIDKCQGACCWEGDFGAPVAKDEKSQIEKAYKTIEPMLSNEAKEIINKTGTVTYDNDYGGDVTPLLPDGSCVYLTKNKLGHAVCSFQKAYHNKDIDFVKPISCQLYPLRLTHNEDTGFEAINYDEWDICCLLYTSPSPRD